MSEKTKITATMVKGLRDETGASIMDCRHALLEAAGDIKKAKELLRAKGKERAVKKSDRETGQGTIAAYIHSNKQVGAMIELVCETDFVAKNTEFQELAYDISMHVAAMDPKYLSIDNVSEEEKEKFEHIIREELVSENKPEEIVEKIVSGKIKKHFEELSLLNQAFIKDGDVSVDDLIKEKIAKIGENIQIKNFVRFKI